VSSSSQATRPRDADGASQIELEIGGMTCASCAARVEKRLNKIDGVTATVNYATEKARVAFPPTVTSDELVVTVEKAGYTATLPAPPVLQPQVEDGPTRDRTSTLRRRLLVSTVLTVPVVLMAMVPALRGWIRGTK
jgi:Cu+-exporting ATPase